MHTVDIQLFFEGLLYTTGGMLVFTLVWWKTATITRVREVTERAAREAAVVDAVYRVSHRHVPVTLGGEWDRG